MQNLTHYWIFRFSLCVCACVFLFISYQPMEICVALPHDANGKFGTKGCYLIQWHNDSSALTELNSQIILCGLALLLLPLFFISALFKVSSPDYRMVFKTPHHFSAVLIHLNHIEISEILRQIKCSISLDFPYSDIYLLWMGSFIFGT